MIRQRKTWGTVITLFSLLAATLVLAVPSAGASVLAPGATQLVSADDAGNEGTPATSARASMSADGNVVAFASDATNLVPNDTNAGTDIFVRNLATGTTERVNTDASGNQAVTVGGFNSGTTPQISADGRYVAFASAASNLIVGDNATTSDIFVKDRTTGSVERVNIRDTGAVVSLSNGQVFTWRFAISGDGRYLAFHTPPGSPVATVLGRVYLRDLVNDTTEIISVDPAGTPIPNTNTTTPVYQVKAISPDARYVLFSSTSNLLIGTATDTNGQTTAGSDLFVRDRTLAVTERVNVADGTGAQANGNPPTDTNSADISADGNLVAFGSVSTNLVANDTNGVRDIFVRNRSAGTTERVTVDSSEAEMLTGSAGGTQDPAISDDGTLVTFHSDATTLVAGDTNNTADVFVRNRSLGITTLESVASNGAQAVGTSFTFGASISGDGSTITFATNAGNLVPDDTNANYDVFAHSLANPPTHTVADFDGDRDSDVAVYRPADGLWYVQGGATIAWGTPGDIAVSGDYNGDSSTEIAVYRPSAGVWYVMGGATVAWGTTGDIPVPGDYDGNGTTDIAVFRPSDGLWYIQGGATLAWGIAGDIPVPGDYDGNGTTDAAIFRPSSGEWFVMGGPAVTWGTVAGDIPVPGNYDLGPTTDIAVFRPSEGLWYILGGSTIGWGTNGDVPVPGDYDGDTVTDIAVFRPSDGIWYVRGGTTVGWGAPGDVTPALPASIRTAFFGPN